MQKRNRNEKKSILGLILYVISLLWGIIRNKKQKDKIESNQQQMNDKWDKIEQEQKEEFVHIDSMSLEDLQNRINRK